MPDQPNESGDGGLDQEHAARVLFTAQVRREQRIAAARANYASDLSDAEGAYAREITDRLFPESPQSHT